MNEYRAKIYDEKFQFLELYDAKTFYMPIKKLIFHTISSEGEGVGNYTIKYVESSYSNLIVSIIIII